MGAARLKSSSFTPTQFDGRSIFMRRVIVTAVLLFLSQPNLGAHDAAPSAAPNKTIRAEYGNLPMSFEINNGQAASDVKFVSRGRGRSLFLTQDEAVIVLRQAKPNRVHQLNNNSVASPVSETTIRMHLLGANSAARIVGADELPGKANYFVGNDQSKWTTNVPTYSRVRYEGIYRGIDLVYYGTQGQLEYDFIVSPDADLNRIRLKLSDAGRMSVDAHGDLFLGSEGLRFQKPRVYQEIAGEQKVVEARYRLAADSTVQFEVGDYDHKRKLVIDPVVIYSTYLGGSGGDFGEGIAVDSSGNAYVVGTTASTDFPTFQALQPVLASPSSGNGFTGNVFISKFNAKGSALIYSTYLGGSTHDQGVAIAVDPTGNAYVTGITGSTDFPTVNALQSESHQTGANNGGVINTAFVSKINPSGSELIYSTYLGGSIFEAGFGIAADAAGSAYITGQTGSPDFPIANALQPQITGHGGLNAFVTKINADGSSFDYSTFLGGGLDGGRGIAVDTSGNAYIVGSTSSPDFPVVHAIQSKLAGANNAFVSKLNPSGSALIYSTYLGGGSDDGYAIAIDSGRNVYVTGRTFSNKFPTFHALQPTLAGLSDAFISKINSNGSAFVYSTFLGGASIEIGAGISVDDGGDAYVTGVTLSADFPVHNALQSHFAGGGSDAFVAEINSGGTALIYSTFFGGAVGGEPDADEEFGAGIAVDTIGNVYVAGSTPSTDFPVTQPFQSQLGGANTVNAFVLKIASDRAESLNLSGSVFFAGSSCETGGSSCNANVVGWSGGFGHVPNGWTPFPGTEKALWEAHLTSEGEVAFAKTVTLTGGKLDLVLQGQKLLSETVTNGTVVWPASATTDLGCGEGIAQATINFQTAQEKPARFSGCVRALPAGSVKPPQIWGIFQHVQ
jgi:hypothetical protein